MGPGRGRGRGQTWRAAQAAQLWQSVLPGMPGHLTVQGWETTASKGAEEALQAPSLWAVSTPQEEGARMMTTERPEDQTVRQTSGSAAGIQVAQLPAHCRADVAAVASCNAQVQVLLQGSRASGA